MSLFSKFRNAQPNADAPGPPEPVAEAVSAPAPVEEVPPVWTMGKAEYDALMSKLTNIAENVVIVNDNVRLAIRKIDTLQSDMGVSINNELILGRDQDKLIASAKGIGYTIDRVERLLENLSK